LSFFGYVIQTPAIRRKPDIEQILIIRAWFRIGVSDGFLLLWAINDTSASELQNATFAAHSLVRAQIAALNL